MLKIKILCCLLFLGFDTAFGFENLGSVSTSLGGAGVGAINSIDGVLNNPSSIALFSQKTASIFLSYRAERIYMSDNGAEALFPAALGYSQQEIDFLKQKKYQVVIAQRLSKKLAVGVDVTYKDTTDLKRQSGEYQTVLGISVSSQLLNWLNLGLSYSELPLNDTDLISFYDKNPILKAGLETQFENFVLLRFEVEQQKTIDEDSRLIYKSGLELYLNEWMAFRLGYQNNNVLHQNYLTSGLGFGGSQYGFHYSFVKEAEKQKESYHSIDLALPF